MEMDHRSGFGSPSRVQPEAGEALEGMRHRPGRSQDQTVGSDVRGRKRFAAQGHLHEAAHPALDRQVEALLRAAAEQTESPAHDRTRDGRHPRVAGDTEYHPAGGQVLDYLIAETSLFQMP